MKTIRHFLTIADFSKEELLDIISLASKTKQEALKAQKINLPKPLEGKSLAMIFEKNSTRTRISFEVGMQELGGRAIFLSSKDMQLSRGECIEDSAKVISSMVDFIMLRVNFHKDLKEFAKHSSVSVINGLSEIYHPMQLLADYMTLVENGIDYKNANVAYIGDGNNMANSWLMLASKLGFNLNIATPKGYKPSKKILSKALEFAKKSGAKILLTENKKEALKNANVVTTDSWVSMGQEKEKRKRLKDFEGFIVDTKAMKLASKDAIFLHCLPAYRGKEVSSAVISSPSSKVFEEANNRLHAQKGVLLWLNSRL